MRIVIFIFSLFLTGCTVVKEQYKSEEYYRLVENSKKAESVISIYAVKDQRRGELTSALIASAKAAGKIAVGESGSITLNIDSIKYFSNWPNGWTEGENEATGKILFQKENGRWKASVIEKFEIWDVQSGSIRYFDDYYRDDYGMTKVSNRMDRVKAVVDFLKTRKDLPPFFGHTWRKTNYGESFKKQVQKFSFPKFMVMENNFKKLKSKDLTDDLSVGEGIIWRKSYTKEIFPKQLHEVRNSGSIYRDFEEAPDLFLMFYNIDYYFDNLNQKVFKRIK